VRTRDARSGDALNVLEAHDESVTCVAFSLEGMIIASSSWAVDSLSQIGTSAQYLVIYHFTGASAASATPINATAAATLSAQIASDPANTFGIASLAVATTGSPSAAPTPMPSHSASTGLVVRAVFKGCRLSQTERDTTTLGWYDMRWAGRCGSIFLRRTYEYLCRYCENNTSGSNASHLHGRRHLQIGCIRRARGQACASNGEQLLAPHGSTRAETRDWETSAFPL